jgi:hypothetical protein
LPIASSCLIFCMQVFAIYSHSFSFNTFLCYLSYSLIYSQHPISFSVRGWGDCCGSMFGEDVNW